MGQGMFCHVSPRETLCPGTSPSHIYGTESATDVAAQPSSFCKDFRRRAANCFAGGICCSAGFGISILHLLGHGDKECAKSAMEREKRVDEPFSFYSNLTRRAASDISPLGATAKGNTK